MCLVTAEKVPTVCDEDFAVYKVIWKRSNRSEFHDVVYEAGKTYQIDDNATVKTPFLAYASPGDNDVLIFTIGYHAFTNFQNAVDWVNEGQKVVKFTIPKGALYFNDLTKCFIVSDRIVAGDLEPLDWETA